MMAPGLPEIAQKYNITSETIISTQIFLSPKFLPKNFVISAIKLKVSSLNILLRENAFTR